MNESIGGRRRGAPLTRREEGAYSSYVTNEQRSQRGWIGGENDRIVRSWAVCLLVPTAIALAACAKNPRPADDGANPRAPSERSTVSSNEPRGTVRLLGTRAEAVVSVEVVKSRPAVERGLMYREHLGTDDGMLFLMDEEIDHTFWMQNTLIPLDMIFIGRDMKVVGVVANATPKTTKLRSVGAPSLYVLEVNGGWAAAHGVDAGASVRFEGTEGIAK